MPRSGRRRGALPHRVEQRGRLPGLSDGACYVLRFGESTGESSASDKSKDKKDAKKVEKKDEKKDEATPGSNRYLFVMAEFNQDAIPKPVLEEFPKEEKKAEEKKPDAKKPDEKKADGKSPDAKDAKPAADAGKKDEPKKDEPKKDEKKVDLKAQRERITTDNKRKQEEYDAKVAAGKKHFKELNDRFADWYYVISDDVYRKIHLTARTSSRKRKPRARTRPATTTITITISITVAPIRCRSVPPRPWSN